jgi:hypothetical protein
LLQADTGEQWVYGDDARERGKAHLYEHGNVHDLSLPPFRLGYLEMLSMKVRERFVLSVVDGDALLTYDEDEKSKHEREAEKYGATLSQQVGGPSCRPAATNAAAMPAAKVVTNFAVLRTWCEWFSSCQSHQRLWSSIEF